MDSSTDHGSSNETEQIWIVQKFGGTSIGKFAQAIANDIVPYARKMILYDSVNQLNR